MKLKITKIIIALFFLSIGKISQAQQFLGRTTGNYTGTYGVYNNASSIGDSKYKFYFNFWGRGLNFYNNYLDYNAPIRFGEWYRDDYNVQYKNSDGKLAYEKNWFIQNLDGKNKYASFNNDYFGPAIMFPVGKNANFSINTRQRHHFSTFGISENFARMMFNGIDSGSSIYSGANSLSRNTIYNQGKFAANIQSYQELSFTLAGVLAKNSKHQLDGGATVKFIRGLGAAYIKGDGFNASITGNNSASVNFNNLEYGYSDDKNIREPFSNPGRVLGLNGMGFGAGFDIGLTYTYRKNRAQYFKRNCHFNDEKSNHDFKLAIGFNDIGGIVYGKNAIKYTANNPLNTNINVSSGILDGFHSGSQNAMDSIGQNVFGNQLGGTRSNGFSTSLPAAFNLNMDFRWSKNIYTTVYWNQSLKGESYKGMRATSMISVIPRFETRFFEYSMPITLNENYKNFNIGSYVRLGPVFIGSDNLGGLIGLAANSNYNGADIYGGVTLGIGHCWWSDHYKEDVVEPVVSDTVETLIKDTIYLNKTDTIRIKETDTLYIEKTVKSKTEIEKEKALNKKEIELNEKQKQLEQKEKELRDRERGVYNESEDLRRCKDEIRTITNEVVILRTNNRNLENENDRLRRENEELRRRNNTQNNEIINLRKTNSDLDKKVFALETEINNLKKNCNSRAYIKTIDSLKVVLNTTKAELENCKKNSTKNDAEVITKLENQVKNLTYQVNLCKNTNDSFKLLLEMKTKELEECKKINNSKNDAEILAKLKKCEDEKNNCMIEFEFLKKKNSELNTKIWVANRKSDSLDLVIVSLKEELEKCKKGNSSSQNEAELLAKLKKCEDEKNNCTIEFEFLKKKNSELNTKIWIANRKVDSLNIINQALRDEIELLKKNSNNSTNDAEILAKLKKCEDDKKAIEAELSKTKGNLTTFEAEIVKLKKEIEELKNSNNDAETLSKLKACEDEKAKLEAEIKKLKENLSSIEAEVLKVKNENNTLKTQKSQLEAEIADLKSKVNNSKSDDCETYKVELQKKTKELEELNTKYQNLNNNFNELKTEYNFVNGQLKKCNANLDTCKKNLNNLKAPSKTEEGFNKPPQNDDEDEVYSNNNKVMKPNTQNESDEDSGSSTSSQSSGSGVGGKILLGILDAILTGSESSSSSSSSSGTSTTSRPSSTGNTGTTTRPSSSGSTSTGTTTSSGSTNKPTTTGSTTTTTGTTSTSRPSSSSTGSTTTTTTPSTNKPSTSGTSTTPNPSNPNNRPSGTGTTTPSNTPTAPGRLPSSPH